MTTPTVRKLQLGSELRRLREAAGRTPADAAKALDCVPAKISRLELGQSAIGLGDLKLLLEFYGADPEHASWMVELSRDNRRRGRWTGHRASFPEWFRSYVDLEQDAQDIRIVASEVVPGLLQTEPYMRVIFEAGSPFDGPADVDDLVKARRERQDLLRRADPPNVSVILSESCVRRMVGGREVMAEQVAHLAALADTPRVRIRLRPFDGATVTGASNPQFAMLHIPLSGPGPALRFVYCEDLDEARYIDDEPTVRSYEAMWRLLSASALDPGETRNRLEELARELGKDLADEIR